MNQHRGNQAQFVLAIVIVLVLLFVMLSGCDDSKPFAEDNYTYDNNVVVDEKPVKGHQP